MPVDLSVDGAQKLQLVARALREVGDKELRRELFRGLERATKPAKEAARQAARTELPARGGLAEKAAKMRLSTRRRTGRDPGITLVARSGLDLRSLERGRLRHPVFGNRRVWVNQQVPAGWFEGAVNEVAPDVRRELIRVLDDVAEQVARRG